MDELSTIILIIFYCLCNKYKKNAVLHSLTRPFNPEIIQNARPHRVNIVNPIKSIKIPHY